MTVDEKKRLSALEHGQTKIISKLDLIYMEVKRTNGRVTKLEDREDDIDKWQATHEEYTKNKQTVISKMLTDVENLKASDNKSKGASAVLYFIAGVGGAIAVALLEHFLKI